MASILKTTVRRFNGVDWDAIHFSTSADITEFGNNFSVAGSETGFAISETINASDALSEIIKRIINRMATLDNNVIPNLTNGEAITSVDADKISGIINRVNLPVDVSGKGVEVESESAKDALLYTDINQGDIVKITGGKVYLVTESTADSINFMAITDEAANIIWSRITETPTTLDGYGITDAVNNTNDVSNIGGPEAANKVVKTNAEGKLDFDITGNAARLEGHDAAYFATSEALNNVTNTIGNAENGLVKQVTDIENSIKNIDASQIKSGTIDIDRLPKAAIERMHIVQDETELETLTTEQVQNGDTVKIADKDGVIGSMYYVTDDSKLGTEDYMQGLMPYSAGTAATVTWVGVTNKPTTLSGYGITDGVSRDMLVTEASAANQGKILILNAEGKLPVNITGDAATLEGHNAAYFATAESFNTHIQNYTQLSNKVDEIAAIVIGDEEATSIADRIENLETSIGSEDSTGSILYNIKKLQDGTGISALDVSKLNGRISYSNLPEDILSWSAITGKPTTLEGYGIEDAVELKSVVDTASLENAGKIIKINTEGKLNASITGDAATLEGHNAAYFATADALKQLSLIVPLFVNSVDEIESAEVGQMVIVPIGS